MVLWYFVVDVKKLPLWLQPLPFVLQSETGQVEKRVSHVSMQSRHCLPGRWVTYRLFSPQRLGIGLLPGGDRGVGLGALALVLLGELLLVLGSGQLSLVSTCWQWCNAQEDCDRTSDVCSPAATCDA